MLFAAVWTTQEGGGRPLTKGNGQPLSDPDGPLTFPRNFNRVSTPDANSCAGCHNQPAVGGGGDIVANVFVLGQRFDFATFDPGDLQPTKGVVDESGRLVTLQSIANSRATPGMFGSGYIEMLARQMTADLQAMRNRTPPGGWNALHTKGISFGHIRRSADGGWDVSGVEGLVAPSLRTTGPDDPPSLVVRLFHQASSVVSIREFTNNAFNHHHGIQSTERFGLDADPDGDGFTNELTRADVTAVTLFQAAMAVPGRVIPDDPEIEAAVWTGEQRFGHIGCTACHVRSLPLVRQGWLYSEPNPFNPAGNMQVGDAPTLTVDLTREDLPLPRLRPRGGVIHVPAFTDLKVHNICDGPDDPNTERLDMNQPAGSPEFFAGNQRFITRKLWGAASEPPFFHHGMFTTLREAVLAHGEEARASRRAFEELPRVEQDAVIDARPRCRASTLLRPRPSPVWALSARRPGATAFGLFRFAMSFHEVEHRHARMRSDGSVEKLEQALSDGAIEQCFAAAVAHERRDVLHHEHGVASLHSLRRRTGCHDADWAP